MAEKKDPRANLKPFKPGQSGNPGGRAKLGLTGGKLAKLIDRCAQMNREALQAVIKDPATEAIELYIASIFVQGIKTGDYSRLEALLNRVIGKVKDAPQDHNVNFNFRSLPRDEVIELGRDAIKYLQSGDGDAD